jgi:UDP-GlcNAc:undecaprenyl-phosphate/decaprenyl-phosphate GlcNAc-1-phosphate transferase
LSANLLVLLAAVPSFLIAWAAVPWVRERAAGWGLVARPRLDRFHKEPTPLGGGIAIWLGVVVTFAAAQLLLWLIAAGAVRIEVFPQLLATHFAGLEQQAPKLWILLAAGTVMMILGLVDDRGGIDWRLRLGVQTFVAAIIVWQGWRLTAFIDAPLFTAALSVIWIVGIVNAFNMLDNMDGLSAGVAWIAAAILIAVILTAPSPASNGPQLFVAGFLLVLAGAIGGFWWHNRPPATIFMGDAGSYFVGFSIATATLMATFAGGGMPRHAVFAPLCVLAVPIYDMLTVIAIRLRAGRSPFEGDKNHFSHRLVALGLTPKLAVWTIYLLTTACGLGALLLHQVNELGAVVILVMVGCMLAVIAILEATARRDR